MEKYVVRYIIKALPVIAGAVGAWIAANLTPLHNAFCSGVPL
jgi:hypothetical protein